MVLFITHHPLTIPKPPVNSFVKRLTLLVHAVNATLRRHGGGGVGVAAVEEAVADGVVALDEGDAPGLEEGVVGDVGLGGGDVGEGSVGALAEAVHGVLGQDRVELGHGELGVRPRVVHVDALHDERHVDLLAEQADARRPVQRDPVPHVLDPLRRPLARRAVRPEEVSRVDGRVYLEPLITV